MTGSETFDVVRMYDPALVEVVDAGAMGRYSSDRDLDALKRGNEKEGWAPMPPEVKPVVFTCRLLSRQSRRVVTEQTTPERKFETAFRLGVLSISNLPNPHGGGLRTWTANRAKPWDAISDEALDETGLGDPDIWEIGSVVMSKSFLALGTPLACPQLDSSVRAWVATSTHFRLAEQTSESETPQDAASS